MKSTIYFNNKLIPHSAISNWENKRIKVVSTKLDFKSSTAEDLATSKQGISYDEMIRRLKNNLIITSSVVKLMEILSFKKRKFSSVEMVVEGMTAEEIIVGIDKLLMEQNKAYDFINLVACPDHYVLRALGNNILEVIETPAGLPFPTQFYINFGQETGLQIPRDSTYPFQSVGIAKLKSGTIIGGVRHQFKNEGNGFRAKLAVEFPLITPNYFIKQHQFHLACEFGHWFKWLAENANN